MMTQILNETAGILRSCGYAATVFETGRDACEYLDAGIDGQTVGIGGSSTIQKIGIYEKLLTHNTVFWHWKQDADLARREAMTTDVYLTSVNAIARTGEMISIDGVGNRLSSMLFGHKKIYFVIGRNKLTDTCEQAVWRARNIAAPRRARELNRKTPCAVRCDKCYDCKSTDRICRGMVTLWEPMSGMEAEVLLVNEDLGL